MTNLQIPKYTAISITAIILGSLGWFVIFAGVLFAAYLVKSHGDHWGYDDGFPTTLKIEVAWIVAGSISSGFLLILISSLARAIRDMAINSWHLRRSQG